MPRGALKFVAGSLSLAASLYLYLLYQQTEILLLGVFSIVAFGTGSYILISDVRQLKPFGRMLPFIVIGASATLALATLGLSSDIAESYYASVLSLLSARVTSVLFAFTGTRVPVSGDVLAFPNGTALSVGPLCSGAYSSILFMLLSLVMVADVGRSAPRKKLAAAVMLGLLGANLANVLRIVFLASVMYAYGPNALDVVHQFAGYAIFLGFMGLFWTVSLRWVSIHSVIRA